MALGSSRSPAEPPEQRLVSTDPHQDERTRRGAMPKSRRQGRGRHWHGPLSQHRPRHVRRLQVGNLVAQHLHRARGREGRLFQPGPPLALLDFPGNSGAQNSSRVQERSCLPNVCWGWAGLRSQSRAHMPCLAEVPPAAKLIHPHPGRHRLEKVQGRAAGNPQRRGRVFRRFAGSAAARDAAGLHHRLGHPQPDPVRRAVRAGRRRLSGRARRVSESAAEGEARVADQHPELEFSGALRRGAGVEFSRQIHLGSVGPASLLFRLQPSARLGAAPEDRRH